jgi:hypothetical protein
VYRSSQENRGTQPSPNLAIVAPSAIALIIYFEVEDGMARTVDVLIPVEPEAAAALSDGRNREAVGRLVSRVLRPRSGPGALARAVAALKAEARAAGLTDAEIEAELAAYNAERRERGAAD